MSNNPSLVAHGTAGGTAINVDLSRLEHAAPVKVQLTASYSTLHPPGAPTRPSMTGCPASGLDFPKTVNSGQVLSLLAAEAAALVAAGKATYV
jgi:hypothetical protein